MNLNLHLRLYYCNYSDFVLCLVTRKAAKSQNSLKNMKSGFSFYKVKPDEISNLMMQLFSRLTDFEKENTNNT